MDKVLKWVVAVVVVLVLAFVIIGVIQGYNREKGVNGINTTMGKVSDALTNLPKQFGDEVGTRLAKELDARGVGKAPAVPAEAKKAKRRPARIEPGRQYVVDGEALRPASKKVVVHPRAKATKPAPAETAKPAEKVVPTLPSTIRHEGEVHVFHHEATELAPNRVRPGAAPTAPPEMIEEPAPTPPPPAVVEPISPPPPATRVAPSSIRMRYTRRFEQCG